jgi:hypothetical protein
MSFANWLRMFGMRVLQGTFVVLSVYLLIATIDLLFGTSLVFLIWQWLGKVWLYVAKWLQYLGKFALRWFPGVAKRFAVRRGIIGFSKIGTTVVLAFMFYLIGGHRYRSLARWFEGSKATLITLLVRIWSVELWFFPRWLRACVFVVAVVASIIAFAQIQEWAEARNSPALYGIDPWSFTFGLVASFFLTKLPLIGFDHFLSQIFKPLRHHYRRFIRRKGVWYTALNWLIALRPARRRAELERKRFMRRWHEAEMRRVRAQRVASDDSTAPRAMSSE